jgi:hypothetical protein
LNSECSQQNRANENKHGADRQHIEIQGKVIGLDSKHSKLPSGRRKTAPAGSRGRSRRNTHRARCFGDGGVGRLGRTATGSPPETVHPLGGGVEGDAKCQRYKRGMCALLIRGYGQNVPPCTSALGQCVVFGSGGSKTYGFKAALPRQRLGSKQFYPMLRCGHSDAALRSSMVVVDGVEVSFPTFTRS